MHLYAARSGGACPLGKCHVVYMCAQARKAGEMFKGKSIDYVLTSPFVRCLQTSGEIVAQLGLAQGRWLVVWPMCEVRRGL